MDYQVSARKHRPMSFAEVTGQAHVVRTLTNAIASSRTAHAYLFSGMRGVGKTTMARILAKALNCEKGPTPTPCLTCASCREIGAGTSFDVMEIDGASSNSVDDVREMRETIKTAPAHGRYRVYIIDEVHMLSTAAFNALLKTLEEPPGHVVFVFATTESHKIPQTILSRCQHFTFRRIPRRDVIDQLKRVAAAEGITVDERSLSTLARASEGSLRDALSLLDQAVAFGGKRVASDDLVTLLGSVPHELLRAVLEAVLVRDAAGALRSLAAVQDYGCDVRQFCGELMEHVRNLLVAKVVADAGDLIELGSDEQAEVQADAARLTLDHIQELFRVFLQAEDGIRTSQHPWFVVEMAVVRACRVGGEQPGTPPVRSAVKTASPPPKSATPSLTSAAPPAAKAAVPQAAPLVQAERPQAPSRTAPALTMPSPPQADSPESATLDWVAVVTRVQAERLNIGAFLEESALVSFSGDVVTIGFPASASAAMKTIQQKGAQQAVEDACSALAGRQVRLRVTALDGGTDAPTVEKLRRERDATTERHLREEVLANPLVKEVLSVFGGEVKDVRRNQARNERENKEGGDVR
ncbi:MAG TPA: DNA polymerase III subunit gamma/tau [Nitrospirales bacterium]|nr:DNA polymerase III subunit gamma/tau [Nitrospirales bacterium]